jgi:hypothetical protein
MALRHRWHARCASGDGHSPERHVVPTHTIVFGQQKLRNALRGSQQQGQALGYGFILLARKRGRRMALGIITPGGESLALTPRLLAGLARRPLWLYGTAAVAIEAGDALAGLPANSMNDGDLPLASVLMHVEGLDRYAPGAQRVVEVEARVIADALVQPLVVLTTSRPAAWPL